MRVKPLTTHTWASCSDNWPVLDIFGLAASRIHDKSCKTIHNDVIVILLPHHGISISIHVNAQSHLLTKEWSEHFIAGLGSVRNREEWFQLLKSRITALSLGGLSYQVFDSASGTLVSALTDVADAPLCTRSSCAGKIERYATGHGYMFALSVEADHPSELTGVLTVWSHQRQTVETCLQHDMSKLTWLCRLGLASLLRHLSDEPHGTEEPKLSQNEVEVLRWLSAGKSLREIAFQMGLSERNINFHVVNAIAKTGARNGSQAALRAVSLGLI